MSEKMNRREFIPLAGAGAILAPTILSACSVAGPGDPEPIPGTVAYSTDRRGKWDIIVSDMQSETVLEITKDTPGNHRHPVLGPDGELYFDSDDGVNKYDEGTTSVINRISNLRDPQGSMETIIATEERTSIPELVDGKIVHYSKVDKWSPTANIRSYDSGTITNLAEISGIVSEMKLVPGTQKMFVLTGGLNTLDLESGSYDRYLFNLSPGSEDYNVAGFESVAVASNGRAYSAAARPERRFYHIYSWDFNNPTNVSDEVSMVVPDLSQWYDFRVESVRGEDYLFMSYMPDVSYSKRYTISVAPVEDFKGVRMTPRIVPSQPGNNRSPSWIATDISDL
ncbi:hypothetical protein ACFL3H_07875 [Gemmatimonadota bacterium]